MVTQWNEGEKVPGVVKMNQVFTFPTDGEPQTWTLPTTLRSELATLFTELDIDAEIRDAYAWVLGSPARRKTARGMRRYLIGWLTRSAREARAEQRNRRRAAQAPTIGTWREECAQLHTPTCAEFAHHYIRLRVATAGCPHPGVCQTFAECQQKGR